MPSRRDLCFAAASATGPGSARNGAVAIKMNQEGSAKDLVEIIANTRTTMQTKKGTRPYQSRYLDSL